MLEIIHNNKTRIFIYVQLDIGKSRLVRNKNGKLEKNNSKWK